MKTVHEWIRETDIDKLADAYFYEYPIEYERYVNSEKTVSEIKDAYRKRFHELIEQLKSIEPKSLSDDERGIFFCHKAFGRDMKNQETILCFESDILKCDNPQTYSWILTDFDKIMGYYIAATESTTRNINYVLTQIIYEMTFFGYSQEDIEKERFELEEAAKEADEGKTIPAEKLFADLGIEPQPRDEEDTEMLRKIYSVENQYNQHWLRKEVEKAREQLMGVLPPDNNTGLCYDHQGVVKYARAQRKRISELSESEKRKFLYSSKHQ